MDKEECVGTMQSGVQNIADALEDAMSERDTDKGKKLQKKLFALEVEIQEYIEGK